MPHTCLKFLLFWAMCLAACSHYSRAFDLPASPIPYRLDIPEYFPEPNLPEDNPLIEQRVRLGERLFHDPMLSRTGTVSCATCHKQAVAFSDDARFSQGVGRGPTRRHSMPLFNLAWKEQFFWDGRSPSLRDQVLHPIRNPNEMGMSLPDLVDALRDDPSYRADFRKAFGSGRISPKSISFAMENYLLTLTSSDSKFDQAMAGLSTFTDEESRGRELFMTEFDPVRGQRGAACFACHTGALFTDNKFHNNGLNPLRDRGLGAFTRVEADDYKFATPSLRNVALTAPYMHDGRFDTLEEVIAHYNEGLHPTEQLSPELAVPARRGLNLMQRDQAAIIAFLKTLTDPQYLSTE